MRSADHGPRLNFDKPLEELMNRTDREEAGDRDATCGHAAIADDEQAMALVDGPRRALAASRCVRGGR